MDFLIRYARLVLSVALFGLMTLREAVLRVIDALSSVMSRITLRSRIVLGEKKMAKNNARICANCKNWKCYEASDWVHPEDESGKCKITGEVVYGDDEACEDDFKAK